MDLIYFCKWSLNLRCWEWNKLDLFNSTWFSFFMLMFVDVLFSTLPPRTYGILELKYLYILKSNLEENFLLVCHYYFSPRDIILLSVMNFNKSLWRSVNLKAKKLCEAHMYPKCLTFSIVSVCWGEALTAPVRIRFFTICHSRFF